MKTCKTCKFWDGECNRVEFIHEGKGNKSEPLIIRVDVSDDTGLDVRMVTSPDFGCILHEPKPEPNSYSCP